MATATRGLWRRRRSRGPLRALTAASTRLDLEDRNEARRQKKLRQGWQSQAWDFRDGIGELHYAVDFLANCTRRMKLFIAAYPETGESDNPEPLKDVTGLPDDLASVGAEAIRDLGQGKLAIGNLLHALSTNKSVAGESWLLGQTDERTGRESWTIRSVDEIIIADDSYQLREVPSDTGGGSYPMIDLDPDRTVISRIWTPHPRWRLLADSPMRAMLGDCDSLEIMRRMIRSDARARLNRGLLLMPEELEIQTANDDNEDPEADPFIRQLTEALIEPIGDEGAASAVAPILIRGPGDRLAQVKHLSLAPQFEEQARKIREELIGIIATSFDLPKEVIQGVADLNHWSAWQVDDNTFRHHVEPHVIDCCDSLTGAYLRPYLEAAGFPPEVAERCVIWYDPTELVTHPDQTKDALDLHDRLVLSDDALLKIAGFDETDRPSKAEVQVRMIEKLRNWPPNLVMAFLHAWDPSLIAPPITNSGEIPGIKPSGVDTGTPQNGSGPATPGLPASPTPAGPPAGEQPPGPPPSAVTASARSRDTRRLCHKLAMIDRDLRTRLQTAANAAMLRQLERAGAKLRLKVAKDETARSKISHRPNERVSAILGETLVAATGLTSEDLLGGDWSSLRGQFYDWTEAAQKQAIATAIRLGALAAEDDAVQAAETAMAAGRDAGWDVLSNALTNLGHQLLYEPDPNVGPGDWADLNPDTLVPTGTIRAALAVAGGGELGVDAGGSATVELGEPVGQIGTGTTIENLLTTSGAEQTGYEWSHGPALKPFEPHEALDGVDFESFESDVLANSEGFPANAFFFPGDHQGCVCDFVPMYTPSEEGQAEGTSEEPPEGEG